MDESNHFFDTNVLLYLMSDDAAKADVAEALWAKGGLISVQVLNEFSSVASRKLGLSWGEIREILDSVRAVCGVVPVTDSRRVDTLPSSAPLNQPITIHYQPSTQTVRKIYAEKPPWI